MDNDRADVRGGLTIEQETFVPVTVTVGHYVYIVQGGEGETSNVAMDRSSSVRLARAIIQAIAPNAAAALGELPNG